MKRTLYAITLTGHENAYVVADDIVTACEEAVETHSRKTPCLATSDLMHHVKNVQVLGPVVIAGA